MRKREEKDFLGKVFVSGSKLYGPQTQRAIDHFPAIDKPLDQIVTSAYAKIKKAAALANCDLDLLSKEKREAVCMACDAIISGQLQGHFPLTVWQASAGTNINMNINEVIAHWAKRNRKISLDAHDDVNLCQSTNDTFAAVSHMVIEEKISQELLKTIDKFLLVLAKKIEETKQVKKVARTHLMDAVSIYMSEELSAYYSQMKNVKEAFEKELMQLLYIPLGATAVGNQVGAYPKFGILMLKHLRDITKKNYRLAKNFFESLSSADPLLKISSHCKWMATVLFKMASDIVLLASGPKAGIGEVKLPENEPGSSIMPGKVNPTQCDFVKALSMQVIGNDTTISLCAMNGNFSLNVYRPLILHSLMQSIDLLAKGTFSFTLYCLNGIKPNLTQIEKHLKESYVDGVLLNEQVGYDKASLNVRKALKNNRLL
jgi:fumarate hydratase class II